MSRNRLCKRPLFGPLSDAAVHIEDRGYQLADGVYEVWSVMDGKLADAEGHFARLDRSLGELSITPPMDRRALTVILRRDRAPQPGSRGPALSADHPGRRPARSRLSLRRAPRRRWW